MDIDRPHFRTTSTGSSSAAAATATATSSEIFICFTSRLSSSSMKLSKSLLSPGRAARDPAPASLSRRLRSNGSLKAGQASPFFPTTGKKRGCGFDNPEPTSPKVTCIGQVRVKTKKKVKQQTRSLSKRRTAAGEVSFRKIESDASGSASAHYQPAPPQDRNQRWVHLPISICEALRTFGAEFSCLLPCKSSCFSTNESEREKSEKQSGGENGCGAVFARWLVSVNDGEGGKRREIELVVGGGDEAAAEEEEERRVSMRSSRRHVFEDIEVRDDRIEMKGRSLDLEREEEAARVSICIPPKNALLLMRCGSDPMKMAALAKRFSWDAAAAAEKINEDEIIQVEEDNVVIDGKDEVIEKEMIEEKEMRSEVEEEKLEMEEEIKEEELDKSSEELAEEKTELDMLFGEAMVVVEEEGEQEEEEVESNMSSFEDLLDQENAEQYEDCCPIQDEEKVIEEEEYIPVCHLSPSTECEQEEVLKSNEAPLLLEEPAAAAAAMDNEEDESLPLENEEEAVASVAAADEEDEGQIQEREEVSKNGDEEKKEKEKPLLPECLLLMMCEPKLSMEISRETWVCSTDFTRWLPERPRRASKPGGGGEPMKRRLSIDSKLKPITVEKSELQQPPRSSCTLPAAAMATMIEQKLVNAVAYEPFVLTRCKSEPMRTAAAKLAPESCFWKNAVRKMEPHAAMGVGAAGVGF